MNKDQKRYQGMINKAKGKFFEEHLDKAFDYYLYKGIAVVEKTPEPMRPSKSLGNGKFIAFFEKKAQPDYKGTIKNGISILLEAKYTSTGKMEQGRVEFEQAESLTRHQRLGAKCYVVAGFSSGFVYRVPWSVWQNMKDHFGRKYVTEADLEKYRVAIGANGLLLLLDKTEGEEI